MKVIITVHANQKHKEGVEQDIFGKLHLYTKAIPQEGKANQAIREILARHYNVAKTNVILIQGHTSKIKQFEIG